MEDDTSMLIGYIRVSTASQKYDRQLDQLVEYGVDERNIYEEKISGTRSDRPELNRMLDELKEGDVVVVADLTRISRSSKDLLAIVDRIKEKKAGIKSLKNTWLDTTSDNPYQQFLLTVMSGLSQLERDLISSRVKEGMEAAKKRGHYAGRPKTEADKRAVVRKMDAAGMRVCDIVTATGLSRSTVNRILGKQK